MNMKKYIKYNFGIIFILVLIFVGLTNVNAKTLNDLKKELSSAEEKYKNNQEDKAKTESEISETKAKINSLNKEKIVFRIK